MSNTGSERLAKASTDANRDSDIWANVTDVSVQAQIITNTLDRVI